MVIFHCYVSSPEGISINACLRQRTCERSKESHGVFGSHMERPQMKDARGLVMNRSPTDEHVVISGVSPPHTQLWPFTSYNWLQMGLYIL